NGPAVVPKLNAGLAGIDHWFNRDHHPLFQFHTRTAFAVVGPFGFFVQVAAYAVPYQFFNHAKAVSLGMLLYYITNIAYTVTNYRPGNTHIQAFHGDAHQLFGLIAYFADSESISRIAYVAIKLNAAINRHQVAFNQLPFAGKAV